MLAENKEPISLLLLNIDYFKLFNDYYDLEGDATLINVAQQIANRIN